MKINGRTLFFFIVFIIILLLTLSPINDPDFWWHLRTGQWVAENHTIPHTDPFSYTANGEEWVAHEWLSDLFIYSIYRLGGFDLLMLAFSLIIFGTFLFIFFSCEPKSRTFAAGLVLLLGAAASLPLWGIRPQMISMLFTSLLIFQLERYQQKRKKGYLIPIPILMLVWVNSHGGYLLGLGVLTIFIGGSLIDVLVDWIKHKDAGVNPQWNTILILCGTFLVSLAATLVNPYGLRILTYPFQTLTDSSMQQFIVEWFSPDFHDAAMLPFAGLLMLLVLFGLLGSKRMPTVRILLVLAFGFGALTSVRHIPLFVVVVVPVLAGQISSVLNMRFSENKDSILSRLRLPEVLGVLLAAMLVFTFIRVSNKQDKVEETYFPKDAADWVLQSGLEGNVFSSYTWGGYLIWKLYPQQLVYIDGRMDVYSDDIVESYQHIYYAYPDWLQLLNQSPTTMVLVEPDSELAAAMQDAMTWEIVYQDTQSVIFSKHD